MSPSNPLLQYAKWYAGRGWPVLALHTAIDGKCSCGKECDSPGKHPRYNEQTLPHGVKSASIEAQIVEEWWTEWPVANIGIATGEKSFDALDVDNKNGVNGLETLADFQLKHGPLSETVEQKTGGGGRQLLFQYSGKMQNSVKFAPGLDTRSTDGYVVAPPSLHVSGKRYEWHLPPDKIALAVAPEWLLDEITSAQPLMGTEVVKNEDGWVAKALEGVESGQRDDIGIKLVGYFFERGLAAKEVLAILNLWNNQNKPPMSGAQVEKIVRSGSRWELGDQANVKISFTKRH